jgi:hypothetical protein
MIYLKKEANVDYDFWLAHAPESGKKLRQIFLKANLSISEPIGHYDVSKVLAHTQATESETEFFLLKGFSQFMEAIGIDKYCPEVKNYKIKIEKND